MPILTFRQISGHPVIVEGRIYHHSIRLGETIRMSYRSFLCDHCMLRRIIRINPKSIRMELIRIDWRMIRIHGSRIASLSIRTKFPITVTILSSLSFKVTGTSVYHPNESVICLELPFMAKLDGLSAFYPSALIAGSFIPPNLLSGSKKDSEIVKSFILAFRYCKDDNHSSGSFDSSSWAFRDKHIFRIGGESLVNSWSYVSRLASY